MKTPSFSWASYANGWFWGVMFWMGFTHTGWVQLLKWFVLNVVR